MAKGKIRIHRVITPAFHLKYALTPNYLRARHYGAALKKSSQTDLEVRNAILAWRLSHVVPKPKARSPKDADFPNYVWTFWDQELTEAPPIVKKCIESQALQFGERLIVLNDSTIHKYLELPDFLITKRHLMSTTHFSDVLRLLLLSKYGGTWVDATVYLSSAPKSPVTNLFAFSRPHDPYLLSSWFLQARPQNYLITKWLNTLLTYWRTQGTLIDYFLLHHLFEIECLLDQKFWLEWATVPGKSFKEPHVLQSLLGASYSPALLQEVLDMSDVHKLTYKFESQCLEGKTVLNYLLNGDD